MGRAKQNTHHCEQATRCSRDGSFGFALLTLAGTTSRICRYELWRDGRHMKPSVRQNNPTGKFSLAPSGKSVALIRASHGR